MTGLQRVNLEKPPHTHTHTEDAQDNEELGDETQLLLTYSQLGPRAIHFCAWGYVFTRIATYHVTTHSCDILAT